MEARRKPDPPYLVCVDTNILVRVLTSFKAGNEPTDWQAFKTLIEQKKATLLVPEVVLFELDKFIWNSSQNLLAETAKLEGWIEKQIWNEVKTDLLDHLAKPLEEWRTKKATEWREQSEQFRSWLEAGTQIPFTEAVSHRTKRRFMSGRFPKQKDSEQTEDKGKRTNETQADETRRRLLENDCFIVDSLVTFFDGEVGNKQLLFCTDNLKDFGREVKGTKTLDAGFKDGLPPTQIFGDLESLAKFVQANQIVAEPTTGEIEQVLKFEQQAVAEVKAAGVQFTVPLASWQVVRKMSVTLAEKVGDIYRQVGTVDFDRIPITKPYDYRSTHGGLTFEQAREISLMLANGSVVGIIGPNAEYYWREGTEF